MAPLFSIIITTFNREELIVKTLETVFHQTYKNFEVIVVDDCSTDGTVEVLKEYEKSNKIRLFLNERNLERCASRNIGLENAIGDFATLLDSDDFMYENCLADAAHFIQQNPECQFFHNHYELVDDKINPIYHYQFPKKNFSKRLAEGNFLSCIGNFVSKEIYTNFKFSLDPKVLGSEDWELWLRVYSEYDLGVIPKINHGVRNHLQRSVNSLDYDKIVETKLHIIDQLSKNKKFQLRFKSYQAFMKASVFLFAAVGANKYYQFNKARDFIQKALHIYPVILFTERFVRVLINTIFQRKKKY